MATKMVLRHQTTGKEFEIVRVSPDKATLTLKGEYATFDEPFNKENLKRLGYELVKKEVS